MFHYCLPLERRTVWPLIKQLIFAKFHWTLPHSLWNIQECKMVIDRWSEKAERITPDNGWSEKMITWIFCFGDPKAHTIYFQDGFASNVQGIWVFTFPSSPPVEIYCPSGEYDRQLMLLKWPCCFSTYVSLCHSQTRSWPNPEQASPIQSPVLLKATEDIVWSEMLHKIKFTNK